MPPLSFDTALHLLTSALILAFGIGAWRAKRESAEGYTSKNVKDLAGEISALKNALANRVTWKDFDRAEKNSRRVVELELENITNRIGEICDRVERIERKVFNGGHT